MVWRSLRFAFLGVLLTVGIASAQGRPNIVVITIDDEDVASLDMMVEKGLMPNLKRHLLDVGDKFTEAFVVGSYGATTRAGFLTGQYPQNHREIGSHQLFGAPIQFDQSSTIATWLQRAGYRTGLAGRYIPGYGVHSAQTMVPPGWSSWAGLVEYDGWATDKYKININGAVADVGAFAAQSGVELYQTDLLAWIAGEFIWTTPQTQPFFLWVTPVTYNREMWPGPSTYNVCPDPASAWFPVMGGDVWGLSQRPPLRYFDTIFGNTTEFPLPQTPSFNEEDMSDKAWWIQQTPSLTAAQTDCLQKRYWRRLEVLRSADDLIGHVFAMLSATNTLSTTVVIFNGDSGVLDGQHRYPEKGSAYDEVIRMPLVIRTRTSTTARQISRLVLNTDLAPTIAQIAGVTPGRVIDGRSLVPLMQNPAIAWRKAAFFQHGIPSWGVGSGSLGIYQAPHFFAIRTDTTAPATFVHYPGPGDGVRGELYDLAADPFQLKNLYLDTGQQQRIGIWHQWLTAFKTCSGTVCQLLENYFPVR
jgi:arylsulfatase A-like enzyme